MFFDRFPKGAHILEEAVPDLAPSESSSIRHISI